MYKGQPFKENEYGLCVSLDSENIFKSLTMK